jgi:proteasome lid subunit RPN8/RPN11
MRLGRRFAEEIVAHAREGRARDVEVCGVLLGQGGEVRELVRVKNVDPDPRIRYAMDPQGLFGVMRRIDDAGLELVAIYHSHPRTRAYPSETDRRMAHDEEGRPWWPGAIYLICSLEDPAHPDLRAFRLFPDHAEDVTLDVA